MKYPLKKFLPLIFAFLTIAVFIYIRQIYFGTFDSLRAMTDFMAGFFLVFGLLKVAKWKAFTEAYAMYDILAKRSKIYAYIYPLLELSLGFLFLFQFDLQKTAWLALILMSISIIGVTNELINGRKIPCACMGTVFKIPMTWVTFLEDALMIAMALIILF